MRKGSVAIRLSFALLTLLHCQSVWLSSVAADSGAVDSELRLLINEHKLTGDPSTGRTVPSINDPLAQLGKKLFFSKLLSGDLEVSCASCHQPLLGGTDNLPLPVGVDAIDPNAIGPNRSPKSGQVNVPRNSPTTLNVALWDQVLFFDGRIESLGKTKGRGGNDGKGIRTPDVPFGTGDPQAIGDLVAAQARFPVITTDEMRGRHLTGPSAESFRTEIAKRVEADPDFRREFGVVIGKKRIQFNDIAHALSAYERSQVFTNNPWRKYVQGDLSALSESAKRGAVLFYAPPSRNGAHCASCHSGDFFTDEKFHIVAIPQVGPGKYERGLGLEDHGRYIEEQKEGYKYAFRTPTLLNVEVTHPYGHSGAYSTLRGVVQHHLSPSKAIAEYSPEGLPPEVDSTYWRPNTMKALGALSWAQVTKQTTLLEQSLTEDQVTDLLNFLLALTDPCVKDSVCMKPWVND